jgi:hypothetical protein
MLTLVHATNQNVIGEKVQTGSFLKPYELGETVKEGKFTREESIKGLL